jgi:hypothetical protein
MDKNTENFDQLRQMLKLKQHEVPPPGYFDRLPREIIGELRAQRRAGQGSVERLESEAPWLMRFWRALEARPLFGGAFGAAVCALVLGGIYLTEKPADRTNLVGTQESGASLGGTSVNTAAVGSLDSPLLLAATNMNESTGPNLFDLLQPLQTAPVSTSP